jgi:hypothetical protein
LTTDDRFVVKRLASRVSGKRSKNLPSAILGTIIATAIVTGLDEADDVSATRAFFVLLGACTAIWAAHVYSDLLADRLAGHHRMRSRDVHRAMVNDWPLLQSTLPIAVPLLAGAFEIISDHAAFNLATLIGVATLVGWGVVFSRREGHGPAGIIGAAALNALVGLLIIGLEVAIP